jgi:hypothetical protein
MRQMTKQTYSKIMKIFLLLFLLGTFTVSAQGIGFEEDVDDETEQEVSINGIVFLMLTSALIYGWVATKKKVSDQ